jgi:transcriptional regulator with XRE-family HTH domain
MGLCHVSLCGMAPNVNRLPDPIAITSTELGRRVGLSQSSMSRIRHGERMPGKETWALICTELGIPESYRDDAWDGGAIHIMLLLERVAPV